MRKFHFKNLVAVGFTVLLATQAQALSLGEFEYQNSCSQCHGMSGMGDGPVTDFLSGAEPTDLTTIQKNNGGVFPVTRIYSIIEGGEGVGIHGDRDMPMWGTRYRARTQDSPDFAFSPADTDAYVKTRILSLIEYLAGIQVE